MDENRVITYTPPEEDQDSFRPSYSFRIDDHGIKREGFALLPWQDVQRIRAWETAGDGDWGFDEFIGLEITYTNGYQLRLTDAHSGRSEFMLLYRLHDCLRWFLPTISPDWRQEVWADYQRHYRRQQWLGFFWWRWYPNKPVIFRK
ncbi:hypothetical protein [Hymenobacter sp. UYP22]|uniref:hypothetical protein n=1 Tax=Hymenobacter sp. UYP22 TaxID=3156348 RepID=UPI0033914440